MREVYLGSSGLVVSQVCLGTNLFGGTLDAKAGRAIVERFRDHGGSFLDTADVYHEGESERIVGAALESQRDEVVLATKVYGATGPGVNHRGTSRRHLITAIEESLRRLRTDYIDLYQIHRWDPTTPIEELLRTLDDLVCSGKVLYVGASNFVGWQLERCLDLQDRRGYSPFVSLQSQYSLVERSLELEVLDVVKDHRLSLLAWSPLASGLLAGKYTRGGGNFKGQLAERLAEGAGIGEREWAILDVLAEVAAECEQSPPAVAVAWLCAQGRVVPIVGASRPEHLDATCAGASLLLDEGQLRRLSEVSDPPRPYPYSGFPLVDGRPPPQFRWPGLA